jgi:WD40 repeat protein
MTSRARGLAILVVASAGLIGSGADTKKEGIAAPSTAPAALPARVDRHGDSLPPGAVARMGTVRWRDKGAVMGLAFLPDGKRVASLHWERTIILWDAATGKRLRQLRHEDEIRGAVFSPDGKLLASWGQDQDVYLWDTEGRQVRVFEEHNGSATGVAFSPDSKTLAMLRNDHDVSLWEVATGKELRRLKGQDQDVKVLSFDRTGKMLVAVHEEELWAWETASGKLTHRVKDERVRKLVALSPDCATGVTITGEVANVFRIVQNPLLPKQITRRAVTLDGPQAMAEHAVFSPDGKWIAVPSSYRVGIWEAATGKKLRWLTLRQHSLRVAFSADSKTLAAGGNGCTVQLFDIASGKELVRYAGHEGEVLRTMFSPDGKSLATVGDDGIVRLWEPTTGKLRRQFLGLETQAAALAFSPDGRSLAAGDISGRLCLWDVATGKNPVLGSFNAEVAPPDAQIPAAHSLAFSPDGRVLVVGDNTGRAYQFEVPTGKRTRVFRASGDFANDPRVPATVCGVWNVSFSPDGKRLAFMDRLWDMTTGKVLRRFGAADQPTTFTALSPDSSVVVTVGGRQPVRLFDAETGEVLHRFLEGHFHAGVAFSPDSRTFAMQGNRQVVLHEVVSGKERARFPAPKPPEDLPSLSFSPDGRLLATGARDTTVLVWDVTGRLQDGRLARVELTPRQIDAEWQALAGDDAARAHRAIWLLVAGGKAAVTGLGERLRPAPVIPADRVDRLLIDLESKQFAVRKKAEEQLKALGDGVAGLLGRVLAERKLTLEVRRRIEMILAELPVLPEQLRGLRAVEVLEQAGGSEAKKVLEALAKGAPEARLTREARASLQRLASR